MDQETEDKIKAFTGHLRNCAKALEEDLKASTAVDYRAAADLIDELALSINLEGMGFHLDTKLP